MKTTIIISILVLFLGISVVMIVKSFACKTSDNSVIDNNSKSSV